MTCYDVAPGIQITYNHLNMDSCYQPLIPKEDFLQIDHCLEGCYECELAGGSVSFLGEGDLSVSNLCKGQQLFVGSRIPLKKYRAAEQDGLPPWLVATLGFLLGAVFLWASDRVVTCVSCRSERGNGANRVVLLILAITLHNIPEGLAVGVAFGALQRGASPEAVMGAVSIAFGIGLQNFPEGAAVSMPLRREGAGRLRSFLLGQASGLVEPVAGVLGALLVGSVEAILPYALAFAAGAMILVAVHELIPECQRNREARPYTATMGIVAGFAIMMLLDVALG